MRHPKPQHYRNGGRAKQTSHRHGTFKESKREIGEFVSVDASGKERRSQINERDCERECLNLIKIINLQSFIYSLIHLIGHV